MIGNELSKVERKTGMSRRLRSTATVLAIAAATFAASLAVAWPKTTLADGDDDGEWTADGMKFGDVVVKTDLVRDMKSKTGWVMVVTAKNDSDVPAKCKLEEDVTRSFSSPGARASRRPPSRGLEGEGHARPGSARDDHEEARRAREHRDDDDRRRTRSGEPV